MQNSFEFNIILYNVTHTVYTYNCGGINFACYVSKCMDEDMIKLGEHFNVGEICDQFRMSTTQVCGCSEK